MLTLAAKRGLSLSKRKSKFGYEELRCLGYIVGKEGIAMDHNKIEKIMNWPVPANVKYVSQFLGLVQYYRSFIPDFAARVQPLTRLKRKPVPRTWQKKEQQCFDRCKELLCEEPVLKHLDFEKLYVLCTGASDIAISGILAQPSGEK